jgi:DNA-binding beta-propeller fold protein YncE
MIILSKRNAMRHVFYPSYFLVLCFLCLGIGHPLCQESVAPTFVEYLAVWGEKGDGPGQFQSPQGISVDPAGFLYIADTGNQRIQKLDAMGRFMGQIGGFGWEKEQFDHPVALCASNGLDVFVADYYNQRIERYDKDLHYLASFTSSEEWPEHHRFGFPLDAALSLQGELFCLDGENRRVLKLDVLGNPQSSFGDFDAGEGRLIDPQRLIVSNTEKVYISDEKDGRIVVFDIHGNYLQHFGDGVLERPVGMTFRYPNTILVVDRGPGTIVVFSDSGALTGYIRTESENIPLQVQPYDVAAWRDRLYVLDNKNHRILVFRWVYRQGWVPR